MTAFLGPSALTFHQDVTRQSRVTIFEDTAKKTGFPCFCSKRTEFQWSHDVPRDTMDFLAGLFHTV